jgi:translation initiation factor IF-3
MFRMREMRRPENGFELLKRVAEDLEDAAHVDRMPTRLEGRDLTMVLRPLKKA